VADYILIDQLLQFLHKAPGHRWECFTLNSPKYSDVDLLALDFIEYSCEECEVLRFDIVCKDVDNHTITIPCNVRRSISHVIFTPELKVNVDKLEFLGTRNSGYNLQCIGSSLRLYTNVAIEIDTLSRFIDGEFNELWKN